MNQLKHEMSEMVSNFKKRIFQMESFQSDLTISVQKVSEAYEASYKDMENEFNKLFKSLEDKKQSFLQRLLDEEEEKKSQINEQLNCVNETLQDAEAIVADGARALQVCGDAQFEKEMCSIKERITMSPAYRMSLAGDVSDFSCWLAVDFTGQTRMVERLAFLTAPERPVMIEERCEAYDNKFFCSWIMPRDAERDDAELDGGETFDGETYLYNLQFRQVDTDHANQQVPWKTVSGLTDCQCLIEDLLFDRSYLQVRCQARNKRIPGEYSAIVSLPTRAYSFQLDPQAAHASLKLKSPNCVEWDAVSVAKGSEPRSRPTSAADNNRSSPKKNKPKDRFIGESYTILGDTPLPTDECSYFEVACGADSKTYGVGLTANSLSRYEQLGRTATSWAVIVNKWLQSSMVAKHNNKQKTLDNSNFPTRIGVYYNPTESCLSFCDVQRRELIYTFSKVRRGAAPLVVGLSVWRGELSVCTGLQVPSWVDAQGLSPSHSIRESSMKSKGGDAEDNS